MKTRFYCESCGAAVKASAKRCPRCGRLFTSVKCPGCGFEGTARSFARGCPSCGYVPRGAGAPSGAPGRRVRRRTAVRSYRLPRIPLTPRATAVAAAVLAVMLLAAIVLLVLASRR